MPNQLHQIFPVRGALQLLSIQVSGSSADAPPFILTPAERICGTCLGRDRLPFQLLFAFSHPPYLIIFLILNHPTSLFHLPRCCHTPVAAAAAETGGDLFTIPPPKPAISPPLPPLCCRSGFWRGLVGFRSTFFFISEGCTHRTRGEYKPCVRCMN